MAATDYLSMRPLCHKWGTYAHAKSKKEVGKSKACHGRFWRAAARTPLCYFISDEKCGQVAGRQICAPLYRDAELNNAIWRRMNREFTMADYKEKLDDLHRAA